MNPELLVAICAHRTVTAPTVSSLESLRMANLSGQFPLWQLGLFVGDALISRSRSQACTRFLEQTQIPYMLFVDDDIAFNPQDALKILNSLKSGYDIIGGAYPVRGASQLASYGWEGKLELDGSIKDIEYLSTGFMGISRRLLERMIKELNLPILNPNDWSRCYPFFEAKPVLSEERERGGGPIYISEDWWFCHLARKLGVKIYLDTSVQVGHLREEMFLPNDVLRNQTQAMMQKQIYGAMFHQRELMLSVDTDLSEFLHIPVPEVQRRMGIAQGELARIWEQSHGKDFYVENEWYLYDLATFNRQEAYFMDRLGQLLNLHKQKVLDIGCGIGTAVFMLAEEDNEVLGWDVDKKLVDFARYKKDKYKLGGEFTTDKPDYSQFSLIVAVDTLEHIQDLEGFIKELGQGMKSGAKFYHSDYFPKDKAWPMHYEEHAERLPGWLKDAGLLSWDGRWAIKI